MPTDLADLARGPRTPIDLDSVRRRAGVPARRRRVVAVVLVVALVAVYGLSVTSTERRASTPVTAPTTAVPAFDVRTVRGFDDPLLLGAPVSSGSRGALAIVQRNVVNRVDRGSGLWSGDFPAPLTVVGGFVLWVQLDHAWAMPVHFEAEATDIGRATAILPTVDGFLWLIEERRRTAIEVGVLGDPLTPLYDLAEGEVPIAATDGGLIVEHAGEISVLDPATRNRRVVAQAHAIAASPTYVLLAGGQLVDVASGNRRQLSSFDPVTRAASFSPDGRYVATWSGEIGSRRAGVSVYDAIAGSRVRFHRFQSIDEIVGNQLVWSQDSDALYFLVRDGDDEKSASRLIGVTLYSGPQTVVRINEDGWKWLVALNR